MHRLSLIFVYISIHQPRKNVISTLFTLEVASTWAKTLLGQDGISARSGGKV